MDAEFLPAGLSHQEVDERIRQGLSNRVPDSRVRDYAAIVARNVFTLFNLLVVPAAVALFLLDERKGAVAVSGMALVNTLLGLAQEIRAKRQLDQLTLLLERTIPVVRDQAIVDIPIREVVRDEVILLRAGDAIVADGEVLLSRFLEIDEALLTGESDPVARKVGDAVLSGSFCVAGEGAYRAVQVGSSAFAQSTAREARAYAYLASPLQHSINRILQVLTAITLAFSALYAGLHWLRPDFGHTELVKAIAATVTSMIPQGLILMATLAFLLGAVRMSRRGVLVQRLAAVESLAALDILCMDKTGTLTTNRLRLHAVLPLAGHPREAIDEALRRFCSASLDRDNKSVQAIRAVVGSTPTQVLDQVPFKSQNRYSAMQLDAQGVRVCLFLGAPEVLGAYSQDDTWRASWEELRGSGLRLLLLAEGESLHLSPSATLRPLALLALSDELRPQAAAVLQSFAAQGIRFKVISGDHAETVRATVAPLPPFQGGAAVVSGEELAASPHPEQLIASHDVFGRISPRQKVQIVETLQRQGAHVAMIGDGVNDVLPIKRADLGIAMGAGSPAARTVADLILETNDFDRLPETLDEGRLILCKLRRCAKVFLLKNVYTLVLLLGFVVVGGDFPYEPQQVTLLNLLTIGLPGLLLTLSRAHPTRPVHTPFVREVASFVLRRGLIIGLSAFLVFQWSHFAYDEERLRGTLLLSTLILLGLASLLQALVDGETVGTARDRRFGWLALATLGAYVLTMYQPRTASFFELSMLGGREWGVVLLAVGLGHWCCRVSDRLATGRW